MKKNRCLMFSNFLGIPITKQNLHYMEYEYAIICNDFWGLEKDLDKVGVPESAKDLIL